MLSSTVLTRAISLSQQITAVSPTVTRLTTSRSYVRRSSAVVRAVRRRRHQSAMMSTKIQQQEKPDAIEQDASIWSPTNTSALTGDNLGSSASDKTKHQKTHASGKKHSAKTDDTKDGDQAHPKRGKQKSWREEDSSEQKTSSEDIWLHGAG